MSSLCLELYESHLTLALSGRVEVLKIASKLLSLEGGGSVSYLRLFVQTLRGSRTH